MKKLLILTLTGMLACAGTAFAADTAARKKDGPRDFPGFEQRVEAISKQLDLTADQKTKVKALYEQEAKSMRENREKFQEMTPEQRREHFRSNREKMDAKMKEILKPEQYQKWQTLRQERGPNSDARKGEGKGQRNGEKKGERKGKKQ